jgi:hypothetical protein
MNTLSTKFKIDIGYNGANPSSNIVDRANTDFSYEFSPRITLKTGIGIPLSKGTENATQNYLSAEGTVEYDVSKKNDGALILRGYSKPMNIGMASGSAGSNGSDNQTYGLGIVWTKSFNTLFKRKDKNKKKKDAKKEIVNKDSIAN